MNITQTSDSLTRLSYTSTEGVDREIILLGTAHVSHSSVDETRELIRNESPDRVCVEIDAARYESLTKPDSWRSLDIYQVLRRKQGFLLLGNLVLSSFQKRMGLDLGIKPGAEMLEAIRCAEELELPFSLCDRQIQITLRRAWAKSSLWGKNKMLAALLSSVFSNEKLSDEEIEQLKSRGTVESMMEELAQYLPHAKAALIDERDRYLATRIFEAEGTKLVAIVGAGHVPGIVRHVEMLAEGSLEANLDDLDIIPPPSRLMKALPYLVPVAVIGLITWGFIQGGFDAGFRSLSRWVLINGTLSAIGAAAAFAHPLTVVASFLAAPITSMNPTIGVGLVAGLLESFFRKPRVSDFENLQGDITGLRGFFRNRITRILLVFLFTTIGSAIGTFIALPLLFPGAI
jgi:pheromone shutdown-related protein TraB